MVLSPVVVPCTMASVPVSRSSTETPSAAASWAMPLPTPALWSSVVVGVFSSTTVPSARRNTQSVKVPPTSMPMR